MPVGRKSGETWTPSTGDVKAVTEGTLKKVWVTGTAVTRETGTAYENATISGVLEAPSATKRLKWARVRWSSVNVSGFSVMDWALVQVPATYGLIDVSNWEDLELLLRERRILRRGRTVQGCYGGVRVIDEELYEIVLPEGEEIRLCLFCHCGGGIGGQFESTDVEYRFVGE